MKFKPWRHICSERCWNAEEDTCRCRCRGAFHGHGKLPQTESLDKFLPKDKETVPKNPPFFNAENVEKKPILGGDLCTSDLIPEGTEPPRDKFPIRNRQP